jgi:predicted metallo-beta-lactamase superfamily hydrolase
MRLSLDDMKMKIIPLAADSLGVRSLSVYVETNDVKICIDPSAALGPMRYGLPPAQEELTALFQYEKKIHLFAEKSDVLVISHYHYDHYAPDEDFYQGKKVFAKNRKQNINLSQKKRAHAFEKNVAEKCALIYCDGQTFQIGKTQISFSEAQPHGPPGTRLGYVLMTTIDDGFRLMHASDVQGPIAKTTAKAILKSAPDLLIMDGPPTYLLGYRFSRKNLEQAIKNLLKIIKEVDCEIILDHHLLRDLNYKERLKEVYKRGNVKTMAEYLGLENNMLEARRKELHKKEQETNN